ISVNDFLYLGSFSRAGGLLLGAGFALLWRPLAILRGPLRDRGRTLDVAAGVALVLLLWLFTSMFLFEGGYYNAWLFRGGFMLVGLATLVVIAAATHRYAAMGRLLGNPVFLWIGTRSYGLYLFHWPVYQIIRKQAQIGLSPLQFVLAMVITVPLTEASYRLVETPIRKGRTKQMLRSLRIDRATTIASGTVALVLLLGGVSMALADPQCVGAVRCSLQQEIDPDAAASTVPDGSAVQPSVITVPPTEATLPPENFVAVGESVMLGAVQPLEQAGVRVNAKENRGPEGVKNAVKNMVGEGRIGTGTTVIVQVGTNAPMSDDELDAIMAEVPADVASVVFMTLRAPVDWTSGNNERILKMVDRYPSVRVLDWAAESQRVELCPDGIHITCSVEALKFYADLILAEVGLTTSP
ncbi:MAG: acyltransferase, partial [Acidobacteria bacterium]|nr:acyltransferase [Acidobacteriota bacterium]